MNTQQSLWRSLFSLGTLLTGLGAVAVWSQEFDWQAGLYLVLLLYIHEVGHVLAARWRRVRVSRPPVFLPGLGAFVMVGGSSNWLDSALVSLGGPLLGGLAALAARQAGVAWHVPTLAFAGDLGLVINLMNLAPISGLDGGHLADLSGWFSLVSAAGFIVYALRANSQLLMVVTVVMAAYLAYRIWNKFSGRLPPWRQGLSAMCLHALTIAVLAVPFLLTVRIPWVWVRAHQFQHLARTLTWILLAFWLGGMYVWRAAWRSGLPAWMRYGAVTLGCWLQMLLVGNPWGWPLSAAAFAATLGLPGLVWLERLGRFLAGRQNLIAGYACAAGYDLLQSAGRPAEAEAWLERFLPVLQAGGPLMVTCAADNFNHMRYLSPFHDLMVAVGEQCTDPESLTPPQANNVAWALFRTGRAREALPYARVAAAGPASDAALDTLGQVLEALGEYAEAEEVLRRAWKRSPYVGSGLALGRALAGQGRHAEAVEVAEKAMAAHQGAWPADELSRADMQALVEEWRAQASA